MGIDFKKLLTFGISHLSDIISAFRAVESLKRIITNRGDKPLTPEEQEAAGVAQFMALLSDYEDIRGYNIPAALEDALVEQARVCFRAMAKTQKLIEAIKAAKAPKV